MAEAYKLRQEIKLLKEENKKRILVCREIREQRKKLRVEVEQHRAQHQKEIMEFRHIILRQISENKDDHDYQLKMLLFLGLSNMMFSTYR